MFFFFFQAEDGIRDWSVTGVQTCALPSSSLFDKSDKISTIYKLSNTIRSKIYNHKSFLQNLDTAEIIKKQNYLTCDCNDSPFKDPNHGHIATSDIRIVRNNKLRRLLCKGPKYKEPIPTNWEKCRSETKIGISTFYNNYCNKKV